MAHRGISSAEKGKGLELEQQQPVRSARVKVPLPDNSDLLCKHSLTLIGRVTNKSAQKVWSLIPFFTEHWKTEFKPVGSDLGNRMFQFQFERESDLLSVLEQRPYHYARWMVIVQRWEQTISPTFPSLIPFWIKVQGLLVHLWTEPTIKCVGKDIGIYEKSEISPLMVRMRVHIDGLLPLIKHSVVEYPNGDEVPVTLVYERLDKQCIKCLRLDHELKECLMARAEEKVAIAEREGSEIRAGATSAKAGESDRGQSYNSARFNQTYQEGEQRSQAFHFSATNREDSQRFRNNQERRESSKQRPPKYQPRVWQERISSRQSSQAKERAGYDYERTSRSSRNYPSFRKLPDPLPAASIGKCHGGLQRTEKLVQALQRTFRNLQTGGFPCNKTKR